MTNNFILKHIVENHYACPLSQRETARLSSTPFTPAISRSPGNDELDQSLTNYPIFELIIQVNVLLRVICSGNAVRVVTRMNANCEQTEGLHHRQPHRVPGRRRQVVQETGSWLASALRQPVDPIDQDSPLAAEGN